MKPLTITNKSVTREALFQMARETPEVWLGIRISAALLVLDGWKSTQVAAIFDISRWSVVKWIQKVNLQGVSGLGGKKRPGRPCRISPDIQRNLKRALEKDPRKFGLTRNRWDGVAVVEYFEKVHGIQLKVRQAQRWIKRLGF